MTIQYRTAVIAFAVAGTLSCARSTRCDEATGACASPVVVLGQDVVLTPGKIVEVETTHARLSFESVASDSRCPSDVQCVWAGNATARVRVWAETGAPRTVELNTTVEPKQAEVNGYVLRFVALTPGPVSTTKIDPADYRLTVRLERP